MEIDGLSVTHLLLSLWGGMISCLSPCVLPILPIFLSYMSGIAIKDLAENKTAKKVNKLILHALIFLTGVSVVFISLGLGASMIGSWLQEVLMGTMGLLIQRLVGIYVLVMGLFLAGWLKIPTMMREYRFYYKRHKVSYVSSFIIGLGFAAGWTPCIGPILSSILLLAASQPEQSLFYILMYILGFMIPFLLVTLFIGKTRWLIKYSGSIMQVSAMVLIAMGIIMFLGGDTVINQWLTNFQ